MTQAIKKSKVEVYEFFMLVLCTYVLIALAVTTFLHLDPAVVEILDYVDTAICFVFMADFFMKLFTAKNKLEYLKWGWIDFLSSIPAVGPLRWGRFARIVRILRLLRGVRSCKVVIEVLLRRRAESAFGTAILIALLMVVFSSIAILTFERQDASSNIRNSEDALWWAFATVTGVGYGDRFPVTSSGRVVAALTMTAGVALFGTFAGFVASWFLAPQEEEQEHELEAIRHRLTAIEGLLNELVARDEQSQVAEYY
jgi:voltage-gated potassium channel